MRKKIIIISSAVLVSAIIVVGLVIISNRLIDKINERVLDRNEIIQSDELTTIIIEDDCCQDLSEAKNKVEHLSQLASELKKELSKLSKDKDNILEHELTWLRKEKKLNEEISNLNSQISYLSGELALNDALIAELQDIIMQQIGYESEYPGRNLGPKVMTEPNNYFRDYVEIIAPDTYVKRAVFRTENDEFVFNDPIVVNTSGLRSGLYYLSFYDNENNLIQAAKPMYRR